MPKREKMQNSEIKIRLAYQAQGVEGYYQSQGDVYQNPHEEGILMMVEELLDALQDQIPKLEPQKLRYLDLCCGSGEATRGLLRQGIPLENIDASDPYTAQAYMSIYQKPCFPWSFVEITQGCIKAEKESNQNKPYDCVICSFALHLCPTDLLNHVLYQLSLCADYLLILTPHKKPEIESDSGWLMIDERYLSEERVRGRIYIC